MRARKTSTSKSADGEVKGKVKAEELIRKKQLLIARKASKLFIKKGYSQTTMREISRTTGINLGNLYNFIDSKEDILCMVFHMFHNPTTDWMAKDGILDIDDPVEQMRVSLRKVLELIHEYKDEIFLMYRETKVLPPKFLKKVLGTESALITFFEGILRKGMERGVFRVKDPFFSANMLVYQLSLYPLRSWNLKRYTEEELLEMTAESIMDAFVNKQPS